MKAFGSLVIGDEFKTNHGTGKFMVYKKTTKSKAIVIDQLGYGNKRCVGDTQSFSANSFVIQ